MKTLVLKRIQLQNWKSLNVDVELKKDQTKISAMNGKGKTSLQLAWNWLLSSYTNASSPKNHELFDNRFELTHETPIARVKAWVEINGIEYTIEKTAQAKFSRKRGTNEWVKDSSDTYKVYIDEIETSASDYNSWLEYNICSTDYLVYCLDGLFFTTLAECDRRKARKVLETIVGEIKESDFVDDYACLQNDFAKGYTIEQIEERVKNQLKPLKKRQEELPLLIKLEENHLFTINKDVNYDEIEKQMNEIRSEIEVIDKRIIGDSDAIQPIINKRLAIFEDINKKNIELNNARLTHENEYRKELNNIESEVKCVKDNITSANKICSENRIQIERLKSQLSELAKKRNTLIELKKEIMERTFNESRCAYCGQDLPIEMLEDAKTKFNKQKQDDLELCVSRGKLTRSTMDEHEACIKRLEDEIKDIENNQLPKFNEQLTSLETDKQILVNTYIKFENTKEYAELRNEIDELTASLPIVPDSNAAMWVEEKKRLIGKLEELGKILGGKRISIEVEESINNMRAEIKTIGCEIASLEGMLDKCKAYNEERANIISHRINDRLIDCKVQMWERQKNGDVVPSCIVTNNDGVKYATLNNSARIKTCISLQKLFCNHFGIEIPTFIDECSIFDSHNLPKLDNQTVYLFASDSPYLTIE